jgi:small-conductance mechanosensitive channel
MDLSQYFRDERLLANLIGMHVALALILVVSVALRKLLKRGGQGLGHWTGLRWLDGLGKEATRGLRAVVFWTTLALMGVTVIGMIGYHFTGRDVRLDVKEWYSHLTGAQIFAFGVILGKLVLLAIGVSIAIRLVMRLRSFLEAYAHHHLPQHVPEESPTTLPFHERANPERKLNHESNIKRWFAALERFAVASLVLGGFWGAAHIVGLSQVDAWGELLFHIMAILTVARLLTLASRTLSHFLASFGDRYLGHGSFRRYWERVTRLFPFGEKCFEAAVYVAAASLCVRELEFIRVVAHFGKGIVQCIGIFFATRVLIELISVFLNEAFGMYEEERVVDQKGQTLVPLLQSLCQYVLYFGAFLMGMRVFEIDTTPILAGAGILGLAGGLGAQSLVTDVVSGFFILFENQYLVGDMVQIGDAVGRVEVLSIRHTQVRDEQGKLYIIPNGQIKTVINFSKGYVNAVVDVKVPTSSNLDAVMRDMAEAGRRLRQARREVIGETVIKGLVELTPSDMVVRAVTKVEPGAHVIMQLEYRRILKAVFDETSRSTMARAA